jgi:pyrroline-5-carboxylate reductase
MRDLHKWRPQPALVGVQRAKRQGPDTLAAMKPGFPPIAFVGGGNMASALIGGLRQAGRPGESIIVIEPDDGQRARLTLQYGVHARVAAEPALAAAAMIVWAVKPQVFAEAAKPCAPHVGQALQLSVMAGIRTDTIARGTGSQRIVRCMPNTPALIGRGITGMFATAQASAADRAAAEQLLLPSGTTMWVRSEADLDAVTALSGSGPAYVYYFIEAMIQAAAEMGLSGEQGRQLALHTFAGATALAAQSDDTPATLRERVSSKGGTTYAALMALDKAAVKASFVQALHAARTRAQELGDEFGAGAPAAAASAPGPAPAQPRRTQQSPASDSEQRP